MGKDLKKLYWQMVSPALILLFAAEGAKEYGMLPIVRFSGFRAVEITFFVLGAAFAIALPIFYRMWFVNRIKEQKRISVQEFIQYQKNTLLIVLVSPFVAVAASVLSFNRMYYFGIILFALYGCYYYFPSQKRMAFEKKIFRIKEE